MPGPANRSVDSNACFACPCAVSGGPTSCAPHMQVQHGSDQGSQIAPFLGVYPGPWHACSSLLLFFAQCEVKTPQLEEALDAKSQPVRRLQPSRLKVAQLNANHSSQEVDHDIVFVALAKTVGEVGKSQPCLSSRKGSRDVASTTPTIPTTLIPSPNHGRQTGESRAEDRVRIRRFHYS
jgi:hypothetical protein